MYMIRYTSWTAFGLNIEPQSVWIPPTANGAMTARMVSKAKDPNDWSSSLFSFFNKNALIKGS